ncbi:hypothetical protein J4E83_007297 [Alternaria metachromatica]|uniref:uncharacterized protein n=1 Tax=Alternaria metachromatica TaxID=283354 RepID=UPI0020C45EF8|nr:uncharacterized protein J4E83_007297 [Alternaria metachromatica]KAI4613696.1 hypothetical protein J4E83_007297 [Alternaria metachromatica]
MAQNIVLQASKLVNPAVMTGTSLFSRAHKPRVSPPKKMRGFLALPGEIRNQIYGYYFDSECRCEIASKGSRLTARKPPPTVKLSSNLIATKNTTTAPTAEIKATLPIVVRFSRSLGKYNAVQGLRTNWPGSLCALSLVCKQVYAETVKLLYQNTTFVFDAPKRMTNFFKYASSIHLGSITKLHLHYSTYGNPNKTVDVVWQEKHHQSW